MHSAVQQQWCGEKVFVADDRSVAWQGVLTLVLPGGRFCARVRYTRLTAVVCLALLRSSAWRDPCSLTNVINGRLIGLGVLFDSEPHSPLYQSFPVLSSDNETLLTTIYYNSMYKGFC